MSKNARETKNPGPHEPLLIIILGFLRVEKGIYDGSPPPKNGGYKLGRPKRWYATVEVGMQWLIKQEEKKVLDAVLSHVATNSTFR